MQLYEKLQVDESGMLTCAELEPWVDSWGARVLSSSRAAR